MSNAQQDEYDSENTYNDETDWFYFDDDLHVHLAAFKHIKAFHFDTMIHPICKVDAKKDRGQEVDGRAFRFVFTPGEFIRKLTKGNRGKLTYVYLETGGVDHNTDLSMREKRRFPQDWGYSMGWTRSRKTGWRWSCNNRKGDRFQLYKYYNGADPFNNEQFRAGNCVEQLGDFKNYDVLPTDTLCYGPETDVESDDGGM